MSVNALMAGILLWVASVAGAFWYGTGVGKDGELAKQAEIRQAIEDTRKIAMEGAAREIANIRVRNTTIQGRVETIVRDRPVYRDCKHDADGLRLVNGALAGPGTGPAAGAGQLPGTDAAGR